MLLHYFAEYVALRVLSLSLSVFLSLCLLSSLYFDIPRCLIEIYIIRSTLRLRIIPCLPYGSLLSYPLFLTSKAHS